MQENAKRYNAALTQTVYKRKEREGLKRNELKHIMHNEPLRYTSYVYCTM